MTAPNTKTIRADVEELTRLLRTQLDDYRQLLALLERKADAVRHAHLDSIAEIFSQEHAIVERIAASDRQRMQLLRNLTAAIRPGRDQTLRVRDIAEASPDEHSRLGLLAIGEELRSVAIEAKSRSSKVRAAAEALVRHMNGIMQSVRSALSRAGVYENKGRLALGAQLDFNVDVRS